MKGDFSWFDHQPRDNYTGVLEQQGRVRLDRDGNAAEEITRHLRALMGRDAFGPGRVAVPAEASDSLRLTGAAIDGTAITLTYQPGRVWVDGIPLFISEEMTAEATYLPPPFQQPTNVGEILAGTRDAVILEVWEDAVSGFEEPASLLEPALGGVDTTARVRVCHRLRLRRLAEDEDCATIRPSLQDDPDTIGRLTATPSPTIMIGGDCPVDAGGGYSGDGHRLYCIEVAAPRGAGPRFLWSRFGGGLLGRGRYDSVAGTIAITHNRPMIDSANVSGMLLQALEQDGSSGCWRVAFEATVSMNDDVLSVTDTTGTWPAVAGDHTVFRLWDGVAEIDDFAGAATDLADGIRLAFSPLVDGGINYRPGDRWLFQAREAGTEFDASIWPDKALPQSTRYHRAPLGIVTWKGTLQLAAIAESIEDCRDSFPPLTDPCHCCTLTVGDGHSTHGDEDSIEAAIGRLPAAGGRVCLLPGLHETNAVIRERANIRIEGCGKLTRVVPRKGGRERPVFHVIDSECVELVNMEIITLGGVGVLAEEIEENALRQLDIRGNRIVACVRALQIEGGSEIVIHDNRIRMLDKAGAGVALYLAAADSRIEDNDIGVVPAAVTPIPPRNPDDPSEPDDPNDPCADEESIYANFGFLIGFIEFIFGFTLTALVPPPFRALGGVQIGAGAERIAVLDNRIRGGAGNGITLGGTHLVGQASGGDTVQLTRGVKLGSDVDRIFGKVTGPNGQLAAEGVTLQMASPSGAVRSFITRSGGAFSIPGSGQRGNHVFAPISAGVGVDRADIIEQRFTSNGLLQVRMEIELNRQDTGPDQRLAFVYSIRIEDNDITAMGLSGIGIPPKLEVIGGEGSKGDGIEQPIDQLIAQARQQRYSKARAAAVSPLLELLGNPVIDLSILNNRISGNLRTPFTAEMLDAARTTGFGGISLGFAETVIIKGNRIEENGRRHIDPVCGIFILYGEQVEITNNLIRGNGVFVNVDEDIVEGQRGGITGIFTSTGIDDFGATNNRGALTVKPALRIHDNVVQQPLGRTLTLLTAGPVSIVSNHLTTERTGQQDLDLVVGTVMILSISGIARLPSGGCMLQANQISLGPDSRALAAVVLVTGEDLGFDANQVDAMQEGLLNEDGLIESGSLMFNTLIYARTIRVTGNRFSETMHSSEDALEQYSLISLSTTMNVTTSNQGDHCIHALDQNTPARLVDASNLEFDAISCNEFNRKLAIVVLGLVSVLGITNLLTLGFVNGLAKLQGERRTFANGLDQNLLALNAHRDKRLMAAVEYKTINAALLANEVVRLEAKSLVRADILTANRDRLATIISDIDKLRAAGDIIATRPETINADDGLVGQGRVTGAMGNGIQLASVQLSDARGKAVDAVEPVRTNARGAYSIRLDAGQLEELAKALESGVSIVATLEGEDIKPARSAVFQLEKSAVLVPDIVFTLPSDARPTLPGGGVGGISTDRLTDFVLTRPVLTPSTRLRVTSGRIAPLLRAGTTRTKK